MAIHGLFLGVLAFALAWMAVAMPINTQQLPIMLEKPLEGVATINPLLVTSSLCEYYENIVDQVMETMTTDVLTSAQPTFFAWQPQDTTTNTLRMFLNDLEDHFTFMRAALLTSIRPLVESNVQVTLGNSFTPVMSDLTNNILALNQRISTQLGLMLNAQESTNVLMQYSLPLAGQEAKEVMTAWLRSWLASIEPTLRTEFNERVPDAIFSIMEDFLFDE